MVNIREALKNNLWKRAAGMDFSMKEPSSMGPAPAMNSFETGSVPSSQVGGMGTGPSINGSDINTTSPTGVGALADQNAGGTPVNAPNPVGSEMINPAAGSKPIGQFGTNSSGVPMIGHPTGEQAPGFVGPSQHQDMASAFGSGGLDNSSFADKANRFVENNPLNLTQDGNTTRTADNMPHPAVTDQSMADANAASRPYPPATPSRPDPVVSSTPPTATPPPLDTSSETFTPTLTNSGATLSNTSGNAGSIPVGGGMEIPSSNPTPNQLSSSVLNSPPTSGTAGSMPSIGSPPAGSVASSNKPPMSKKSSLNNTQRFAIGFIKQAMDNGLDENDSVDLLKKISAPQTMVSQGIPDMMKGLMKPQAMKTPGVPPPVTMKPQGNPIQQTAQNIPPALKPVQATPSLNTSPVQPQSTNLGQQDFQQFEQQRQMNLGTNPNPVLNNQVDQQLSNLPPIQAQELIRYLQSKPPTQ